MNTATNRLIAIVVVISAVLIGSNVLSLYALTQSADTKRDLHNLKLVESFVADYTETMLTHISRFSVSDAAFESLRNGQHRKYFTSECQNKTLASDVSTFALINDSKKVLFICEYGSVKRTSENSYIETEFLNLIKGLSKKARSVHTEYKVIAADYDFEKSFITIGDRTYLAIASLVNPQKPLAIFDGYDPVYTVSLINVEKVILDELVKRLPLEGLEVSDKLNPDPAKHYAPIAGDQGQPVSFISWQKSSEFNTLLMTILPSIGILSAISFLLIVRYLMRIGALQKLVSKQEAEARHASLHDSMTGLPNRVAFNHAVDEAFSNSAPTNPCFLGFFDLDHFKQVNDTHGHDAGDAVIVEAAARLQEVLGKENFVARIGGDEFAFVVQSTHTSDGINSLCQKLNLRIKTPFAFAGTILKLSASVGIAEFPKNGLNRTDVLKAADNALYAAKEQGRGRFHIYDQADDRDLGGAGSPRLTAARD